MTVVGNQVRSPIMLKTANNPGGLAMSAFDEIRTAVLADRSQFFEEVELLKG